MSLPIIILLVVCIGVPLGSAWRTWRLDEASRAAWLVVVADAAAFIALVLILGRWDIAGYYTRFALLAAFFAAVLWSWRRHASRPWRAAERKPLWRSHWTALFSFVLLGAALAFVVSGLLPPAQPHELSFPLRGGRFMVGQGGGITLLNHHASHSEQRYAADITAINEAGFRAESILPEELDRYVIYGAAVVSPCDGTVVSARDRLPDLVPPRRDTENQTGNHVIIDCGGVNIELAHLQESSIAVQIGDNLTVGDEVGKVGNSGNTTEPHLHVHAVDPQSRTGVPMTFEGRAPFRNRLYVSPNL
jgi:hypothetical protein